MIFQNHPYLDFRADRHPDLGSYWDVFARTSSVLLPLGDRVARKKDTPRLPRSPLLIEVLYVPSELSHAVAESFSVTVAANCS